MQRMRMESSHNHQENWCSLVLCCLTEYKPTIGLWGFDVSFRMSGFKTPGSLISSFLCFSFFHVIINIL